jgi:predicted nicotinamide N-methyase
VRRDRIGRGALAERDEGRQHEAEAYIRTNFRLGKAPAVPEISLYQPHPGSRVTRFVGEDGPSPYWAYGWGGGTVLARYLLDHPSTVHGLRVLDVGTGSGIVAIAAAKAGAARLEAVDIDPVATVAARLNAEANGVAIAVRVGDGLAAPPPETDLVTVGDLFYEAALARRTAAFLAACHAGGIGTLVGDPGRKHLPLHRLRRLAEATVPDFDRRGDVPAAVYGFEPGPLSAPGRSGTARDRSRRYPPGRSPAGR